MSNSNNHLSKQQKHTLSLEQRQTFSGPIPPPETLAAYEKNYPGLAERIVKMAESEGEHRKHLETTHQNAQIAHLNKSDMQIFLGQAFAFLISIVGLGSAVYLGINGHAAAAVVVGASPLSTLAAVFLNKKDEKK